jgi:hypothetical protein
MIYNWEQFFLNYNINYSGPNSRGWWECTCPYCNSSPGKLHGAIHKDYNIFYCFKCGKIPLPDAIYNLTGISWNSISRQYKFSFDQSDIIYSKMNKEKQHAKKIEWPIGTIELNNQAKDYLYRRGFDPDYLIKKYNLRCCGPIGFIKNKNLFAFRIIIPIYYQRNIISFQGRNYTGKADVRYMTYPEDLEIVHHKDILYGIDDVPGNHVIIVEGILDKWKLGDYAAATFGTGYTDAQVNLIASRFEKVSIMFDPEAEAQKKAEELYKKLKGLRVKSEIIVLSEGDPGSLSDKDAKEIVKDIVEE